MAGVSRDGEAQVAAREVELSQITRQLEELERPLERSAPRWPWLLIVAGLVAIVGLGVHSYTAYATITRINVNSKIDTPNPIVLFQDVATNGPRVGSTVESSSRATYGKALEQFVLDGTGVCLGLVLTAGGLFTRLMSS
jgi:hypothetical protein